LQVEGNFVGFFQKLLSDSRERQFCVCFGDTKVSYAVQAEKAFHGAEALLDPKAAL